MGHNAVKSIRLAILVALPLSAVAVPASAQISQAPGYEFVAAIRDRDSGKAQELLGQNSNGIVNSRGADGETALNIAVGRRDETWTAFLLTKGADPNQS